VTAPKEPIDLRAALETQLDRLTFLKPLRLKDVSDRTCASIGEGTSADYSQGVSLNESVGIFLDWWGWMSPHKRYSFAVFERADRRWQQVQSRIEDINVAVAIAIHTLAEHALRTPGAT
jgi:hypothetical protein